MKYAFSICCLILSLFAATGCSKDKDDEPGNNGVSSGTCKVDGKSFGLKYGYLTEEDSFTSLMLTDTDLFKIIDDDGNISSDVTVSFVAFDFEDSKPAGSPDNLEIGYKSNFKNKGCGYFVEDDEELDKISVSMSGKHLKANASGVSVEGVDVSKEEYLGSSTASFSFDGNVINLSDLDPDDFTRSISVTKVTDAKQLDLLKSLRANRQNLK